MRSVKKGDRRLTIRKKLHALYLPLYDALCEELDEEWQPYFGFRSFEQQDALYAKGRTQPGDVVTYAPGGMSAHNYGLATDWTIFDDDDQAIFIEPNDPRWKAYETAVIKVGLCWGGFFTMVDCYHNEIHLHCSWRTVKLEYDKSGIDSAYDLIKKNI
jgi:peptidoglycan L-alanyl-D-glutamate endopeptidase CwlK